MVSRRKWATGLRRHRRRRSARGSDDGRSGCAAAVGVRASAQRDALHVGHGVGPVRTVQPAAQQRQRDRHGRAALRDALPLRPAQGQVHPVARDRRQVGRQDLRPPSPPGREVERRPAVHRQRRQVHVRDRQARGLGALDDVEDRPLERSSSRATRSASSSRASRTTSTGTRTSTRGASSPSTSGRTTARPRSRPATPTSTWSEPARSPTAPARAPRARCSGTGVTAGGRRRRSG